MRTLGWMVAAFLTGGIAGVFYVKWCLRQQDEPAARAAAAGLRGVLSA